MNITTTISIMWSFVEARPRPQLSLPVKYITLLHQSSCPVNPTSSFQLQVCSQEGHEGDGHFLICPPHPMGHCFYTHPIYLLDIREGLEGYHLPAISAAIGGWMSEKMMHKKKINVWFTQDEG